MSPTKWVVCCSKGGSVGTDDRDVTTHDRGVTTDDRDVTTDDRDVTTDERGSKQRSGVMKKRTVSSPWFLIGSF